MKWSTGRLTFTAGALAAAALTAVALLGGAGPQPATAAGPTISAIALAGGPAPGAGSGVTFAALCRSETFDEPMVNAGGDVAFYGCLSDQGWGLYLKPDAGALTLIARSGDSTAAGTLPVDFGQTDGPVLNDAGTVAFAIRGGITGGTAQSAIFVKTKTGPLTAVLKDGDTAPCAGCVFVRFDDMAINGRLEGDEDRRLPAPR